jgi:hypothetical protein
MNNNKTTNSMSKKTKSTQKSTSTPESGLSGACPSSQCPEGECPEGLAVINDFVLTPRTRASKYPFSTMRVSQGFMVCGVKSPSSVYAAAKRAGVRISTRVIPEGLQVKVIGFLAKDEP